ncbi:MAG: hypothetical protein GWP91_12175 [Rhodobacterales bacterium]|nr:hypothetical protein [Rhodobacterales bacterium]
MEVTLRGNIPAATTAGIMLLTRARQLGYRLTVSLVGDPEDAMKIRGPAVFYAPVLASCGVGREAGRGATVVVPGPPGTPLMVTVHPHGESGWFFVDRTGNGMHPATQAFVRLSRDSRPAARELGREMRKGMEALGLSTDPAVLDVLFGADVPPLTRLALGLRAGRAMAGGRGEPITRHISGGANGDPFPDTYHRGLDTDLATPAKTQWIFDALSTSVRDKAEWCIHTARELAMEDGGRDLVLLFHVLEIVSYLVQLPNHSILPPLGAAEDSVATSLGDALTASGDGDASAQLRQVYRFLGGKYVSDSIHAILVGDTDPPPGDHVGRWRWFCKEARRGRKEADALWPNIIDPPS